MDGDNPLLTTSSKALDELQDSKDRAIANLIGRLLVLYWTENMSATMREAQALDWLEDLREFDVETVMSACKAWRRAKKFRPTIAEIRALCQGTWETEGERIDRRRREADREDQERTSALRKLDYNSWQKLYGWGPSREEAGDYAARRDDGLDDA